MNYGLPFLLHEKLWFLSWLWAPFVPRLDPAYSALFNAMADSSSWIGRQAKGIKTRPPGTDLVHAFHTLDVMHLEAASSNMLSNAKVTRPTARLELNE